MDYNTQAAEILAIADRLVGKIPTAMQEAQRAVASFEPLESFRHRMIQQLPNVQPVRDWKPLDLKPKEWQRYSLARAIMGQADHGIDAGFEREISQELCRVSGASAEGLRVPDEILFRNAIAGVGTLGGMLVQTDNLASEFVSILRNRCQVINMGARVLNLSRQATIPRQSASATANWLAETAASTLSGVQLTQLTLTPQAIGAQVSYSKMLLMESDPSIDFLLKTDLLEVLGAAIDLAALHGSGTGEPTGIANTSGIGTVLLSANGLSISNSTAFPSLVSLESVVAAANADGGQSLVLLC